MIPQIFALLPHLDLSQNIRTKAREAREGGSAHFTLIIPHLPLVQYFIPSFTTRSVPYWRTARKYRSLFLSMIASCRSVTGPLWFNASSMISVWDEKETISKWIITSLTESSQTFNMTLLESKSAKEARLNQWNTSWVQSETHKRIKGYIPSAWCLSRLQLVCRLMHQRNILLKEKTSVDDVNHYVTRQIVKQAVKSFHLEYFLFFWIAKVLFSRFSLLDIIFWSCWLF